jgi:hypothetical protein
MNLGVLTVALLMAWENPTVNTELPRQTSFRSHKVTHRVVSSSTKGNAGDDTIHRTLNLMDIMDLKTIVEKDGPIDPDSLPHQINVLALGGAYCGQEELGFQFMLGTPNVDHIHNDEYMSMCGDSTLSDVDSKNYDIILMMIPNDGLEGFPTLLLCCKHRYPEAVIIYVRTWNFKQLVHVEGNSSELVKFDTAPPIEAKWTTGQGGHAYQMPLPNSVAEATEWFSEVVCFSKRILSNKGNQIVANGILQLLSNHHEEVFKSKQLGAFMSISEHHFHHVSKSCFWTPGDSERCMEMLYTRIQSIAPRIRWFFIGDSTQRLLYYSSYYHTDINSTYHQNLLSTNDGKAEKFLETQSCQNGDLCVCVVNSGFHDLSFPGLTDERYIFNLREYIQSLQPFCRHLIWIPSTSVLESPISPRSNSRLKIWNAMVVEMLNTQPFEDWTSWVDTYKASTMLFHYDSVHLTGGYYTPLAKFFMKVDGMLSEKYAS